MKAIVKFKKLHNDAKIPTMGYKGDACWDFYSVEDIIIPARGSKEVNLGIATEIPYGWEMVFRARSSYGRKGLQVHNGTIDAGYRGYLGVFVYNHTNEDYEVKKGDKVVQAAVRQIPEVNFEEVQELTPSERGEGAFGSSGR